MPIDSDTLRHGLTLTLDATDFAGPPPRGLGRKIAGKVRDSYLPGDGRRVLVTTDRVSAFDRVLGTLPFKGQVLNQLAAWWFEATRDVAPNHVLEVPDPNVTIGIECRPLEMELVVRAYLTGVTSTSIWTHYQKGARIFCGHRLPDGLAKNDPLPEPIVTPSTKASRGGHDISLAREELLALGRVSAEQFDRAASLALALFRRGQEICAERGLILVDTKYEMGVAPDGRIVVIDEIHTPDSSRYWRRASYEERRARGEEPESFDKEFLRHWLAGQGYTGEGPIPPIPEEIRIEAARRYIEAFEAIVGRPFEPDLEPPEPRIRRHLRLAC
jgi:phosphoribosylaminoimidazole-succinocarboxamide synthase